MCVCLYTDPWVTVSMCLCECMYVCQCEMYYGLDKLLHKLYQCVSGSKVLRLGNSMSLFFSIIMKQFKNNKFTFK